jgi:hypothetical protein
MIVIQSILAESNVWQYFLIHTYIRLEGVEVFAGCFVLELVVDFLLPDHSMALEHTHITGLKSQYAISLYSK